VNANQWDRIRDHYDTHRAEIESTASNRWAIDPYAWCSDGLIEMSPIERMFWCDIRFEGVILYPQFPVVGYFVDFGNPVAKVAVECDGKEFHRDADRDARRQRNIELAGWSVYRLSGKACLSCDEYEEDEYGVERVVKLASGRSLLREISAKHLVSMLREPA
jgi:hypothetical protein